MLMLLRQRNFTLLWLGGLISMIGNWVLLAALPYYIYDTTDSALASSALIIAYVLPYLLFGSVAGVFVDRWDRKRTMVVANLIQAMFTLLLLLIVSSDFLWIAYVVVFMESTLANFSGPAENALLPRLVGEEHLQSANAMNGLNDNLARLIGPSLGGALIGLVGLESVVLVDSASFLIAAVLISGIASQAKAAQPNNGEAVSAAESWKTFWREWRSGLALAWSNRIVATLFIVAGIITLGDNILSALIAPFIKDVVQGGAVGFGLVLTVRGVGGLFASLVLGQVGRRISPSALLVLGNVLTGLLLLVIFNVPLFTVTLLLIALIGVTAVAGMTSQFTLLQQSVPDEYRGRVFGAFGSTGALLGLAGTALGGFFGDQIGVVPVLNVSAMLSILGGLVALRLLRNKQSPSTSPERGPLAADLDPEQA